MTGKQKSRNLSNNASLAKFVAGYWANLLHVTSSSAVRRFEYEELPTVTEGQVATFRSDLEDRLLAEFEARPLRSTATSLDGYCLPLNIDYDPDPFLLASLRAAGIECRGCMYSARGLFPYKVPMRINGDSVVVRDGYGAHEEKIWSA